HDALPIYHAAAGQPTPTEWPDPVPLGRGDPAQPLPTGIRYPSVLWEMVDAVAEYRQVPRSAVFLLALPIAAAAAGGRVRVRVHGSWEEQLSIYAGVGMPPGSRKSATHRDLLGGLRAVESDLAQAAAVDDERRQLERDALEKELRQAIDAGKKGAESPAADLDAAARRIAELKDRINALEAAREPLSMTSDDVTEEALAEVMHVQGGRQLIESPEGRLFQTMAGAYSSRPSLDLFLKAHEGDRKTVRRKTGDIKRITIARPVLNIALQFQPAVLARMAETPELRELGLLARFVLDV